MKLNWICFTTNIVVLICFTVLAVVFHKWWIILFALLFLSSVQTEQKFFRKCDGCGKRSPSANNYNEALDVAQKAGWKHITEGNKDYCPDCKNNHEEI